MLVTLCTSLLYYQNTYLPDYKFSDRKGWEGEIDTYPFVFRRTLLLEHKHTWLQYYKHTRVLNYYVIWLLVYSITIIQVISVYWNHYPMIINVSIQDPQNSKLVNSGWIIWSVRVGSKYSVYVVWYVFLYLILLVYMYSYIFNYLITMTHYYLFKHNNVWLLLLYCTTTRTLP